MGSNAKPDKKLTNGAILIISKVLKHVMSSAAEAEIGAVFINAKEGAVLRTTLEELGHTQPHTPVEMDNTTATGYINGTIKQKRTNGKGHDSSTYDKKYWKDKECYKYNKMGHPATHCGKKSNSNDDDDSSAAATVNSVKKL
jgi:hypothetical protein